MSYRNDELKKIGKKIRELRKSKGITQKQLAEMIGKTESSIAKYEKGLVNIPLDVVQDIANACDIKNSDLLFDNTINFKQNETMNFCEYLKSLGYVVKIIQQQEKQSIDVYQNDLKQGIINQDFYEMLITNKDENDCVAITIDMIELTKNNRTTTFKLSDIMLKTGMYIDYLFWEKTNNYNNN